MADQPEIQEPEFPNGPCRRGRVYSVLLAEGAPRTVVMSLETWGDHGTNLESLRAIARKQNEELVRVKAELTDAMTRLNNLRAVRREEKRVELEPFFINPTDNRKN